MPHILHMLCLVSPSLHSWRSVSDSLEICVRLFATPWAVACQVPLFMGILQARILEWIAMPSSRGSSQLRVQTHRSPSLQADSLPSEPPGNPSSPHGSQFIRTQILGEKKNPCHSSDPPSRLRLRPLHCFPCSECTTSAAGLSLWFLIRDSLPDQAS